MIKLTINTTATNFFISTVPAMPEITLSATIDGSPPLPPSAFTWTFALDYPGFISVPAAYVRNARRRSHPPMASVTGNPVKVPLAVVTGGRLTVTVTAQVSGQPVKATRNDILIGGTNPNASELAGAVPTKLIRQMIQQESGGAQFCDRRAGCPTTAINPNWSQDQLAGVGLGQLTNPAPSDADVWNWRTNAASLQQRFRAKRSIGATLHTLMMASTRFKAEATALNDWRKAEGQPALTITLPALTEEQQDWEGLRAYNGLGPTVKTEYLPHINEFEPKLAPLTSATRKSPGGQPLVSPPLLDVNAQGVGSWVQISGAERTRRLGGKSPGDPDYVAHVLARTG